MICSPSLPFNYSSLSSLSLAFVPSSCSPPSCLTRFTTCIKVGGSGETTFCHSHLPLSCFPQLQSFPSPPPHLLSSYYVSHSFLFFFPSSISLHSLLLSPTFPPSFCLFLSLYYTTYFSLSLCFFYFFLLYLLTYSSLLISSSTSYLFL
uniref:Uncharacterized protein n=1 Tax=Cacopsylla melanoneura TaxID=428564 RepID=A0A8D8Q782_9HEMI